jgi:hypothetical protein
MENSNDIDIDINPENKEENPDCMRFQTNPAKTLDDT